MLSFQILSSNEKNEASARTHTHTHTHTQKSSCKLFVILQEEDLEALRLAALATLKKVSDLCVSGCCVLIGCLLFCVCVLYDQTGE